MKVIDHSEGSWYLLEENGAYYLDVNCSQSFVGFSLLIELNNEEYKEYHALGRVFLEYLAARVNYWSNDYKVRAIQGEVLARSHAAIMSWKRNVSA
jgi:hypothetical protein